MPRNIAPKRKHNVYNGLDARVKKIREAEKDYADKILDEMREAGKPKKGQKYLELESIMKFPVGVTEKEILGKVVVNDDRTPNGVISSAKKDGRAKKGFQMWRVISQITDEKFIEAFSQIPAFKKRIKVMK